MNSVQCYDGDGKEPDELRRIRLRLEFLLQERKDAIHKRIDVRNKNIQASAWRRERTQRIYCDQVMIQLGVERTGFHIFSYNHPLNNMFFAGDRLKELIIQCPSQESPNRRLLRQVHVQALDIEVTQMKFVERCEYEDLGEYGRRRTQNGPFEVLLTVKGPWTNDPGRHSFF